MEFQWINFLPNNWVQALYLTLFHSLWIGVVLALLTSIVIVSTKNSQAKTRYNLLTILFSVFALVMLAVFCESFVSIAEVSVGADIKNNFENNQNMSQINQGFLANMDAMINLWGNYASEIVMLWFAILCIKTFKLSIGLNTLYNLKHRQLFDAGNHWKNKVDTLSRKLGISKQINIFQSGLAKVPMVIGHLKPFILVPLGMLTNLSETQVEAILAHELAHIKRKDYLINMMQSFIEIVFFFNPAVWWISNLIKEERENCCDDLALNFTNNKQEYIKALIACQEFHLTQPIYAMAITGRKNQLLTRVRRMVSNHRTSLNKIEKAILSLTLISAVIFTIACTNAQPREITQTIKGVKVQQKASAQDTTKKKKNEKLVLTKKPAPKPAFKSIKIVRIDSPKQANKVLKLHSVKIDSPKTISIKLNKVQMDSVQIVNISTKTAPIAGLTEVQIVPTKPLNLKLHKEVDSVISIRLKPTELNLSPIKSNPEKIKSKPTKPQGAKGTSETSAAYLNQRIATLKKENKANPTEIRTQLIRHLNKKANLAKQPIKTSPTKAKNVKLPTEAEWTAAVLTKKRESIDRRQDALRSEIERLTKERVRVDSSISNAIKREIDAARKKAMTQ